MPARAVPYCARIHWTLLGDQMPTRSPLLIPSASNPAASWSLYNNHTPTILIYYPVALVLMCHVSARSRLPAGEAGRRSVVHCLEGRPLLHCQDVCQLVEPAAGLLCYQLEDWWLLHGDNSISTFFLLHCDMTTLIDNSVVDYDKLLVMIN